MYGRGKVQERNGRWTVDFTIGGERTRKVIDATTRGEAEMVLQQMMEGVRGQSRSMNQVFDALVNDFEHRECKSTEQVISHLRPLREFFAKYTPKQITMDVVEQYTLERRAMGYANNTINHQLQLLGQAVKLARRRGWTERDLDIRYLRPGKPRQGFLQKAELDAVVQHLPEVIRDVVKFGYATGWRRGEIVGLKWEHVHPQENLILLPDTKNGRGRALPMSGEVREIIERQYARRSGEYVFQRWGRKVGDFRKSWLAACRAAGVGGKLFHDLRRTAVRDMVRAGIPRQVAMAVSGHKTQSIFERYNIVDEEDIRQALERTQRYREGK